MKESGTIEVIHKDVVIIGNGPSGIALSYMLSGNLPYLISDAHPDELLSARLSSITDKCLIHQNLVDLAEGLEGRSTNPISLLLDALQHPYADMGKDMEPLVEWRQDGVEIDHVVLGKGPPGGSWHSMDPNILTLSLGSWMSLPGMPYQPMEGDSKSRATAGNVANYYQRYVNEMDLSKNFRSGIYVTTVKQLNDNIENTNETVDEVFGEYCEHNHENKENATSQKNWVTKLECDLVDRPKLCTQPELASSNIDNSTSGLIVKRRSCSISNAFSCIRLKGKRKDKSFRCCKKSRELLVGKNDQRTDRKVREIVDRSLFLTDDLTNYDETNNFRHLSSQSLQLRDENSYVLNAKPFYKSLDCVEFEFCDLNFLNLHNCYSLDTSLPINQCEHKVPNNNCYRVILNPRPAWMVESYNTLTGAKVIYTCNNLILANGSSDLPNRLITSTNPDWLLHDLRTLEEELDRFPDQSKSSADPVLIVGAGLSAADAVIATRLRNIPVLHVFRHKSSDLSKQLPENMYPEYHKVHQMMQNSTSSYPFYTALSECQIADICESTKTVTLMNNKSNVQTQYKVSFVVVLIGSRPDLNFLPSTCTIGIQKSGYIDCKSNPIDLDRVNYTVKGQNGLYALGPLAGDNFVRFIPGGALAIVSELYKTNDC